MREPIKEKLPLDGTETHKQRFREFDLQDKVYMITGGAQGLGLSLAEALLEAGAIGLHLSSRPANASLQKETETP